LVYLVVGFKGKQGCRLNCNMPGRRREGDGRYYPVMLKPLNYTVDSCQHDDIKFADLKTFRANTSTKYYIHYLVSSANPTQYKQQRLETGLVKQSILTALPKRFDFPSMLTLDAMHWPTLNKGQLFTDLW
ncbi:hypothetical protein K435DRAFT_587710, partial [Dendrothele bispora CBS 962.96]